MSESSNPFWQYSLALYRRDEVSAACLALQDRRGLDVNLLLFCCWAGSRGRALSGPEIEGLIAATHAWRDEVVRPLRRARRWLKTRAPDLEPDLGPAARGLREDIKAAELAAEAVQQDLMHRALPLPEGAPAPGSVAANLRAYLGVCGCRPEEADLEALSGILCGACPDLAAPEARRLLAGRDR